jgi:hypothetical protein
MSHIHLLWNVPIFWWHAWGAVMRPLVEDLGILSIAFAFCAFVVRYTELRWSKKSHADAVSESMVFFRDNVRTPLLTCAGLFFVLGFSIGPYEIHQQDTVKMGDRDSLAKESQNLRDKLEDARNNLSVSSPAANNLMYLLQAFRGYRGALGGFKTIDCHVRLTAPPGQQLHCNDRIGIFHSSNELWDVRPHGCQQ